jgi:hypothetical protein
MVFLWSGIFCGLAGELPASSIETWMRDGLVVTNIRCSKSKIDSTMASSCGKSSINFDQRLARILLSYLLASSSNLGNNLLAGFFSQHTDIRLTKLTDAPSLLCPLFNQGIDLRRAALTWIGLQRGEVDVDGEFLCGKPRAF